MSRLPPAALRQTPRAAAIRGVAAIPLEGTAPAYGAASAAHPVRPSGIRAALVRASWPGAQSGPPRARAHIHPGSVLWLANSELRRAPPGVCRSALAERVGGPRPRVGGGGSGKSGSTGLGCQVTKLAGFRGDGGTVTHRPLQSQPGTFRQHSSRGTRYPDGPQSCSGPTAGDAPRIQSVGEYSPGVSVKAR
jgi:hypothetical protein